MCHVSEKKQDVDTNQNMKLQNSKVSKGPCKRCFAMGNRNEMNMIGHQAPCENIHTKAIDFT
jgi:3-methyladenine DNA glycosylase Mpg